MSFATFFLFGYCWTFLGCALVGYQLILHYEGRLVSAAAFALMMLIPMPFLMWAVGRMADRDRRLGVPQ